ncbi:hypothetical protein TVAG_490250 [Trichomonas vaginalis G3]|uniref:Uncharacterized protein n=1 Tax=Trichomonas vaginalis (strain ATCC PRA-98 / G3) TaxID=412133 RepID=A2F0W2_TRIV3|nr:protein ubiquitination [Trichomonas vaginalis G3]EAY01437.1 hypothetical protein TVAG_490250 [Trichomonas vaginalis G3]KAI5519276.1 protein ubiquitination [Trichomonas vaginalis G3]|eukprot:XP_001314141.1 hypothetical protein [Trichomonas vaginalis G3]
MLSSEPLTKESEYDFSNFKPIEIFTYPNQVSKTIWNFNSNNILQTTSQIIDLINNNKVPIQMVLYLIDNISKSRAKEIELFAELYQNISNKFSCIIKPSNERLATLLHYKGIKFENFQPFMKEEEILNLYSTESPLYYIAWDKVDELKCKFPNLNFDPIKDHEFSPFDCAIFMDQNCVSIT